MSYIDPKKLAEQDFTDEIEKRDNSAVVIIAGVEGTGKTHFALTAPKPLHYMATDFGDQGVIQKFKGQQIVRVKNGEGKPKSYKLDIPHHLRPYAEKEEKDSARQVREGLLAKHVHETFYKPFFDDFKKGLDLGVRTTVWDNALDVWEYTRLSVYGRGATNRSDLQAEANNKFREMVRMANVAHSNLILINHLKPKWDSYYDSNGAMKWRMTSDWEMQGFDKAPFLVTCNLWTKFTPKVGESEPTFEVIVKKCRDHQEQTGSVYPLLPFPELMSILIPEVESWE